MYTEWEYSSKIKFFSNTVVDSFTYTAASRKVEILHLRSVEEQNTCMEQQLEAEISTVNNKQTYNTMFFFILHSYHAMKNRSSTTF